MLNLKRLYLLFLAHLRVNTRNKIAFFFSIIFPLIFIGIFGIAFQNGDPANTTIQVGLINQDLGIPENAPVYNQSGHLVSGRYFSNDFISYLSTITFKDNKTKILDIKEFNTNEISDALSKVERREIKALIFIPSDFSLGIMASMRSYIDLSNLDLSLYPPSNYTTEVIIRGDPTLLEFTIVNTVMDQVVNFYFKLGDRRVVGGSLVIDPTVDTKGFTSFDFIVPGLVIYALISNLGTVATIALSDVQSKLINRFKLSKMQAWEYPTALIISQLVMSIIQIPIMFGAAIIFGFPLSKAILNAFVFAIFVSLSMTGIGLILAGLVKNAETVGGLSAIVSTPMAFLAGAFFPMPNPEIIPKGTLLRDRSLGIFDLLPPRAAIDALRLILINGKSISDVSFEFYLLILLSFVYLLIGIVIYSRKHLKIN